MKVGFDKLEGGTCETKPKDGRQRERSRAGKTRQTDLIGLDFHEICNIDSASRHTRPLSASLPAAQAGGGAMTPASHHMVATVPR